MAFYQAWYPILNSKTAFFNIKKSLYSLGMIINLVLFFIPKRQEIYRLYLIKKRKKLAYMMLNSKRFNANSYIIYSDDSAKTVSVKWGGVNSHMTSFLLIDNNRNTSAYITGKISGVAEISKGTGSAAPPVLDASLATLKVTLGPWSAAFLICLDLVTIS